MRCIISLSSSAGCSYRSASPIEAPQNLLRNPYTRSIGINPGGRSSSCGWSSRRPDLFFFRRIDNAKFLPLLTPKTKPIWHKCIARPGWAKLHQPYPGKLGLNFYEQCSIDVCWCETVGGSRGGGVCKVHFCFHLVAKKSYIKQ